MADVSILDIVWVHPMGPELVFEKLVEFRLMGKNPFANFAH